MISSGAGGVDVIVSSDASVVDSVLLSCLGRKKNAPDIALNAPSANVLREAEIYHLINFASYISI